MRVSREAIAYCSNVHAGESLAEVKHNIAHYISAVRKLRGLDSMATGLWLSATAAQSLKMPGELGDFKQCLADNGLQLTSINGFPFGNFHQQQVKAAVYLPDWADESRLYYSQDLADILAACLPDDQDFGAISTVPLGYRNCWDPGKQDRAIGHLAAMAAFLHRLHKQTGKFIMLCLEMEPDCVLESSCQMLHFFKTAVQTLEHHQYIGVCYDVCHQAVMHENVHDSLTHLLDAGIPVGKIQLSNAIKAEFGYGPNQDQLLLATLKSFCEAKYLHQVKSRHSDGSLLHWPDLSQALAAHEGAENVPHSGWYIHFHVPVNAEKLKNPQLKTTRGALLQVFDVLVERDDFNPWLEVETYSWQVLPDGLNPVDDAALIEGIFDELAWVEQALSERNLLNELG